MTVIRDVANAGHAVISTIHQPAAELFEMFDTLLLLQRGGRTAYFGPLGTLSETMIDYLGQNGAPPLNERENPADYMLREITHQPADKDWGTIWTDSPQHKDLVSTISNPHFIPSHIHAIVRNKNEYPGVFRQVRPSALHVI